MSPPSCLVGAASPQLEQTRALNRGLDALTTWARDTLGVDCALVNCDDWSYQP